MCIRDRPPAPQPLDPAPIEPEPLAPQPLAAADPPVQDDLAPDEAQETLDTIHDLAPLEIIGGAIDTPPETDQMRLF